MSLSSALARGEPPPPQLHPGNVYVHLARPRRCRLRTRSFASLKALPKELSLTVRRAGNCQTSEGQLFGCREANLTRRYMPIKMKIYRIASLAGLLFVLSISFAA